MNKIPAAVARPRTNMILARLLVPLSVINPNSTALLNFIMILLLFVIYNNLLSSKDVFEFIKKSLGEQPVHLSFATIAIYLFYRRSLNLPLFSIKFLFLDEYSLWSFMSNNFLQTLP